MERDLTLSDLSDLKEIQNQFCLAETTCLYQPDPESLLPLLDTTTAASVAFTSITSNLPALPPVQPSPTCCEKCSCMVEDCYITDSCCIEALEEIWPIKESSVVMSCEYPQLRAYDEDLSYPNVGTPILMLRKCPRVSNVDYTTVDKCDHSDIYEDIETKIPVTDNKTMYIYKNRFCALCHNVSKENMHFWHVTLECLRGLLKPRNLGSVIIEVLNSESCNLKYSRPTALGMTGPFYQCQDVISKCNVTGHWQTYNPFIEAACLAYSTIYNFKYRNVFCFLCNAKDTFGYNFCTNFPRPHIFVDFSALLKFQPELRSSTPELESQMTCPQKQIFDPVKNQCREIECLFPKTIERGTCIPLVDYLEGIEFGLYLKMTPLEEIAAEEFVARNMKDKINSLIDETIDNRCLKSFEIYSKKNSVTEYHSLNNNIKSKISYVVIHVVMSCGRLRSVKPDIVDKLLSFHNTMLTIRTPFSNGTAIDYNVQVDLHKREADSVTRDQFYKYVDDLNVLLIEHIPTKYKRYPLTELSIPYTCPSVQIHSTELKINESEVISIEDYNATVDLKEVVIERLSEEEGFSVRMCTSLFERIVQLQHDTNKPALKPLQNSCGPETFSAKTILTFICTSISVCCSSVTLFVYLKFKKFKTQPGLNNIVLCLALIVAQCLYQFGSGQSCNISKLSCQIIGAFVHFFWLFLMFWMNSCCIHMFRVFRINQTKIAAFNVPKTTIGYVLYSFLCSVLFIAINVIVSLFISNGLDIGYGGTLCYISQGHMVAYLFTLPVASIVLLNIILFSIVIMQMRNTSKIQNNTSRQDFLHIYAKLSTLTGCTWIFGFCSYFLDIAVVDYIFVILNASQGVFLFFAFVGNRQTLKSILKRENTDQTVIKNPMTNIGGNTGSTTFDN